MANELPNPLGIGDRLADLLSGRSYYEVTDIWVDEDMETQVSLQEYYNNTDSMVERNSYSVHISDIAERFEDNELAFM